MGHIYDTLEQKNDDNSKWQGFLEDQMSELPRGLKSVMDSGDGVLENQKQVLHSYFKAIGAHEIGLALVTLITLLIATQNLVIAVSSAITCTFSFFISTAIFGFTRT